MGSSFVGRRNRGRRRRRILQKAVQGDPVAQRLAQRRQLACRSVRQQHPPVLAARRDRSVSSSRARSAGRSARRIGRLGRTPRYRRGRRKNVALFAQFRRQSSICGWAATDAAAAIPDCDALAAAMAGIARANGCGVRCDPLRPRHAERRLARSAHDRVSGAAQGVAARSQSLFLRYRPRADPRALSRRAYSGGPAARYLRHRGAAVRLRIRRGLARATAPLSTVRCF